MAAMAQAPPVTLLLEQWREGDVSALEQLTRMVYAELRRLAAGQLRGERPGHTLSPTALVAEAFLRIAGDDTPAWTDRVHFLAAASRHMRHILVDHARARAAKKRGAGVRAVTLDEAMISDERPDELLALDDALTALAAVDARKARVIELHYFGGLTLKEVADAVGIHVNTALRDLRFAEAWLHRHLVSRDAT